MKGLLVLASTYPKRKDDDSPRFIHDLTKRIKGFDVHVLTPFAKNAKCCEKMDGVHIHRFQYWLVGDSNLTDGAMLPNLEKNPLLWVQVPFFLILYFIAIIRAVTEQKIKIIHAHWVIPQGMLAVLYKKLFNQKIKVVVTAHGSDIYGLQEGFFEGIKKFVLKNADAVTVVSNALAKEVQKYGAKPTVAPMGFDSSVFKPSTSSRNRIRKKHNVNGKLILYAGRLAPEKNIKTLIGMFREIRESDKKARLIIIGSGTEEESLKSHAKKLNITFLPFMDQKSLAAYYNAADFFVSIPKREGFGLTFAEAMACACVPLGTNVGGIPEVIGDAGITGSAKDLKSFILSKDSAPFSKKAIERAKQFAWEIAIKPYNRILKSL